MCFEILSEIFTQKRMVVSMLVLALSRHSREWIHAFANCSCSRLILPIASLSSNDFYYDHDFPRFFSFSFRTIRIRESFSRIDN